MLFRTLPLEEKAFAAHAREEESTLASLSRFASVKNPLHWEKKFVVLAYSSLHSLAKFDPNPLKAPDGSLPVSVLGNLQRPGTIRLFLAPFQLRLAHPRTVANWPEIVNTLAGQGLKTSLLLFQWQSAHASWGAKLKEGSSLWHVRKLPRLNFATTGIAALQQGRPLSPSPADAAPAWLSLLRGPEATFALRDKNSQSLRYDLIQPLAPAASRLWGSRPRSRR